MIEIPIVLSSLIRICAIQLSSNIVNCPIGLASLIVLCPIVTNTPEEPLGSGLDFLLDTELN